MSASPDETISLFYSKKQKGQSHIWFQNLLRKSPKQHQLKNYYPLRIRLFPRYRILLSLTLAYCVIAVYTTILSASSSPPTHNVVM